MATIVKMPAPRLRTADTPASLGGATILFFTGVRYVREVDDEDDDGQDASPAGLVQSLEDPGVHAAV